MHLSHEGQSLVIVDVPGSPLIPNLPSIVKSRRDLRFITSVIRAVTLKTPRQGHDECNGDDSPTGETMNGVSHARERLGEVQNAGEAVDECNLRRQVWFTED